MHWKIRRDPYLSLLVQKHGEEAAWAAGFFLDDDPDDAALDDVDWLCTPRPKLPVNGARPVVLLSTGGFFPVHGGHLAMMEHARLAAEGAGLNVIGGYLSPGHDRYLALKCGPEVTRASQRLRACAEAVADSDWLSVDPWEAMHRRVAVNFTDVTARLERYLQRHVDARIEVVYVCGGDNARFAFAFSERGRCIVVGRPGADAELTLWKQKLAARAGDARVIWTDGDHPGASRSLRTLPFPPVARARIALRMEDARALRILDSAQLHAFQAELLEAMTEHADVYTVAVREAPTDREVISLDAMVPAQHNLALSRLFAVGGYEALGHVARPGSPPLAQQMALIPPGNYLLWDDDCATGSTLAAVRALLPTRVTVEATALGLDHAPAEDIVDARDFLLGADQGGLVVQLANGAIARAPYLLPYVDPGVRASVLSPHAFSIAVWELNARTFAQTARCVRDLPPPARALFDAADETPLRELCAWHAERVRSISPR